MSTRNIDALKVIRDNWVEERRVLASQFRESDDVAELVGKLVSKQLEIEALDRAIEDEQRLRPNRTTSSELGM
ncbi:hypothetical protein [Mameliella sp.]|uniref:hypothetical protein n=1 Tax=Mameliella sp. TaxID=1924940 RepID=UPI003BAA9644